MNIGVVVKQVPDTATKIKINASGSGIDTADIKWIVNPFDEFAIEAALQTKDKMGAGEVVVFSVGPERVKEAMLTALAMGADRGVRITDAALDQAGPLGIAKALAAAIKSNDVGLVFAGGRGVDDDMFAVPGMLGELLGWSTVNMAGEFALAANKESATIKRKVAGGAVETVEVRLPALVSCDWKMNEPRYASLPGIMKAKKKPLDVKGLADLGLDANAVSSAFTFTQFGLPAERGACKMFSGDNAANDLVNALRQEAKVI